MTLSGTITPAPATLGFDTATTVSQQQAEQLFAQGYKFAARYLNRQKGVPSEPGGALSVPEAEMLLAAGLGLTLVQYGDNELVPSGNSGTSAGEAAAANAAMLGFPQGGTVWCDIEFKPEAKPSSSQTTIEYINAWAAALVRGGYEPGLYVGTNIPLSSEELYESLPQIASYWKAASITPWVANRGFQMIQGLSFSTADIHIDPDIACYDNMHDRFQLLMPQS